MKTHHFSCLDSILVLVINSYSSFYTAIIRAWTRYYITWPPPVDHGCYGNRLPEWILTCVKYRRRNSMSYKFPDRNVKYLIDGNVPTESKGRRCAGQKTVQFIQATRYHLLCIVNCISVSRNTKVWRYWKDNHHKSHNIATEWNCARDTNVSKPCMYSPQNGAFCHSHQTNLDSISIMGVGQLTCVGVFQKSTEGDNESECGKWREGVHKGYQYRLIPW